ncbi:MAG: DegQ family serine endoprotease [Chlamydiae bacterium]|nr:DegQ family serine endoprotease [Chlamydiota bacterium]
MVAFKKISFIFLFSCLIAISNLPAAQKENICPTCKKGFTEIAKKCTPAVVFIKIQGTVDQDEYVQDFSNPFDQFFSDEFFNRFFNVPKGGKRPQLSQGSGFLVSKEGYILTNGHVVKGAEKITVVLNDGEEKNASLVGMDTLTDIAVLKIEGNNFPYISFGNSDDIEVGEWVVAIGNPFQLRASVTHGIISAKGRDDLKISDIEDFIQTDAPINPGNSGGPLINLSGEVIGINCAIFTKTGGNMGIGFAVPSNIVNRVMSQILDKGVFTRGYLGIVPQPVDKDIAEAFNLEKTEGVLISEVMKGSPADKAGLMQGDIILKYNNISIKSLESFKKEISLMNPGSELVLEVNRKGKILKINVTLDSATDAPTSTALSQKMGFEVENLTPELSKQLGYTKIEEGVVITKIKPGSPAALAGLRPGFLIIAINHKKVGNIDEFAQAIKEAEAKKRILILARQGNLTRFYSLKID